ncbi:protein turtle-like [Tachypleus tridentatus]|uniref:protein turtle-like n=1 Tax=Tachypleus tridentatus TaxID=6853 RepID=UPI003FD52F52
MLMMCGDGFWRKSSRKVCRKLLWIFATYVFIVSCLDVNETSSEIQAIQGYPTILPCNAVFPNKDGIALVLWFKADSGVPFYSYDARSDSTYKTTHFSDDPLGSRAQFYLNSRPPALKIENVKKDDEGEYECRVDYRRARTEKWKIFLNVTVPPKSTIIMDENGQRLEGVAGPYNEGSLLFLNCEADGGDPPPDITWWQNTAILDDDYIITPLKIARNELVIEVLEREHLWTVLTCQASNTNFTPPVSSSITLDMNLKPLHVRITSRRRPLSENEKVHLECYSWGARPPARMTWWKDGIKIFSASATTTVENITISNLYFTPEIHDNGKILTCRADNPDIVNSALEAKWKLDVMYLPILSLALKTKVQNDLVKEGDDVYFECNIKANPQVTEIGWQFNRKPLLGNPRENIIIKNHSLVLKTITNDQSGRYRCVGSNMKGKGVSKEVLLAINRIPFCKRGQKTVYRVAPNESIIVECEIEATPSNVSFKWFLNNSLGLIEINSFKSNGTHSEVIYKYDKMTGYSLLYCLASNDLGIQKEPCVFTVIPAGPPDALRNCGLINRSTTVIKVKCDPGYDGGLKQTFHLEIFNMVLERIQKNITKTDRPVFVANDLPFGTSFILALYSSNSKGKSTAITLTASTLSSPIKRTADNYEPILSPVVGTLVGVVLTLFFAGVIIIVFMKLRGHICKKESKRPVVDKDHTLIQKDVEDITDNRDSREPDVIPAIAINPHGKAEVLEMKGIPSRLLHKVDRCPEDNILANSQSHIIVSTENTTVDHDVSYAELYLPKPQALQQLKRVSNYERKPTSTSV